MKYTKQYVQDQVAKTFEEYVANLQASEDIPEDMKSQPSFHHIWSVGSWLQPVLEEMGIAEERLGPICSEHGQRSFHTNPYEVAAWILNGLTDGTFTETPMQELATQLLEEHTRVEMRDGKKTHIMKVWSPDAGANLLDEVERIRNLPPEEREAAMAEIQAELARLEGNAPSESRA